MLSSLREHLQGARPAQQDPVHVFMIVIYRFGAHIPVPGVDFDAVKQLQKQPNAGRHPRVPQPVLRRRAHQFAIFALGIMPYITASIIMQILGVVIPKLEQWQERGRSRPAQDHPVDPLPHGRHRPAAGDRRSSSCSTAAAAAARVGAAPGPRPGPRLRRDRVALIVLTLTAGTACSCGWVS